MADLTRVEMKCEQPGCENTRLIHRASLNNGKYRATRCEPCQEKHKRRKGRERYLRRKGLSEEEIKAKIDADDAKRAAKAKVKAETLKDQLAELDLPMEKPQPVETSKPKPVSKRQLPPDFLEKTWLAANPGANWDDVPTDDDW